MKIQRQGLLLGTMLLLISNIFVKGLGFAYRVILVRVLGAEGMGLVEMISPVFSFFLVIAGWGISLGMTKSIAEHSSRGDFGNAAGYLRAGMLMLATFGAVVTIAALLLVPPVMKYLVADQRIYEALRLILPAIFIVSLASAYRGAFQGVRQVSVLGNSQAIEQTVRVALGIFLAGRFVQYGLPVAVSAVSVATLAGEAAGYLYIFYRWRRMRNYLLPPAAIPKNIWHYCRKLLRFGTPVTVTRIAATGIMMLQAFLIPFSLHMAGYDTRTATELYGGFSGVALALLHLPGVFTAALSVSVMPAVAESLDASKKKLLSHRINNSLQAAAVFTLPGMMILYLFANQLCQWIFNNPASAVPLAVMALCGIFFYLQITLVSILQGLGKVKIILLNTVISGLILLISIYLLTSQPQLGVVGTAWAMNIFFLTSCLLNLFQVKRITGVSLDMKNIFGKPFFSVSISLLFYAATMKILAVLGISKQQKMTVTVMILLLLLVYFSVLIITKGLSIGVWRRFTRRKRL